MSYLISIEDSIQTILSTPKGTRVMLPEFGSELNELIDRKFDDEWRIDCARFCYEAIAMWEPRIEVLKVDSQFVKNKATINIYYSEKDTNELKRFDFGI
jgi:phage baseplate assembly protein W